MIPFLHESRFVLKINVLIHSAKGINLKHIPVTFIYSYRHGYLLYCNLQGTIFHIKLNKTKTFCKYSVKTVLGEKINIFFSCL